MNQMMCCHLASDKDKKDAVVIRIFLHGYSADITIDRDMEVMAIQVAAHIKIGQPAYAVFKNGTAYKYAPGRTVTGEDMKTPHVSR